MSHTKKNLKKVNLPSILGITYGSWSNVKYNGTKSNNLKAESIR